MPRLTPDQQARQIAALTGRRLSPEHIAHIAAGFTPTTRARSLVGLKGGRGPKSAETRARIGAANAIAKRGSHLTAEHRAKIGAGLKGRSVSAETRERLRIAALGNRRVQEASVKGVCVYCDRPATEYDHVIPRGRPGWDDPDNVVIACVRCNHSKGSRTPDEWLLAGLIRD